MHARLHPTLAAALRFVFGGVWLAGAIFNLFWTFPNPDTMTEEMGTTATFGPYRWLFGDVVGTGTAFWIIALIAGEFALAWLMFNRGTLARLGVVGSIGWSVFLFFAIWPYTLMMAGFAALGVWLLGEERPESLPDFIRDRAHFGHEGGTA